MRIGTLIEVRRVAPEPGTNLGIELINLSSAGACVCLKAAVSAEAEVEVWFGRRRGVQALTVRAVVRCYLPGADGFFLTGLSFRERLSHDDLLAYTQ